MGDTGECRTVNLTVKGMSGSLFLGPEILPVTTKVSEVSQKVRTAQGIDAGCNLKLLSGAEELLAEESLEKWALDETLILTSVVAKRPPPVGNYKISKSVSMRDASYDYSVHVTIEANGDGNGLVTWFEDIGGWAFGFDSFSANLKGTVAVGDGGALTFDLHGQSKRNKYQDATEVANKEVRCTGFVDARGLHLKLSGVATPNSGSHVLTPTDEPAPFSGAADVLAPGTSSLPRAFGPL